MNNNPFIPISLSAPTTPDAYTEQIRARAAMENEQSFRTWASSNFAILDTNLRRHLDMTLKIEIEYRDRLKRILEAIAGDLAANKAFGDMMPKTMQVVASMAIKDMQDE